MVWKRSKAEGECAGKGGLWRRQAERAQRAEGDGAIPRGGRSGGSGDVGVGMAKGKEHGDPLLPDPKQVVYTALSPITGL